MKYKALLVVPLIAAMGSGLPPEGSARAVPPIAPPATAPPPAAEVAPEVAAEPAAELRVMRAAEVEPAELLYEARPVVVFTDSAQNPAFVQQLRSLNARPAALIERDVVVIVDDDPAQNGTWRRLLRPEGFSLVILDKDGQVKLRKPFPWDVREITRAIDKFPSRRQEVGQVRR